MAGNTNSQCVVDASFVLTFLLPDENSKATDDKFGLYAQGKINFFSTNLLPFEVLNGIRSAVLRKRVDNKLATKLASNFLDFKIKLIKIDLYKSFSLALKKNLTVYDASYVFLALDKRVPLLTQDNALSEILWEEVQMTHSKLATKGEKVYKLN